MNKEKFNSREVAEKAGNLEQVQNDVPENRMQNKQQVQNAGAAQDVEAPKSSFSKISAEGKTSGLKQEKISQVLTGSVENSGMGINAAGRAVSGTTTSVLGAGNSTPQADRTRRGTRVEKKFERIANKLNYTPNEQVLVPVRESKPLCESASDDQGFGGTYRNTDARSQKIMGAVPGDLMYQRSVDFISKDKLYFLEGQYVYQNDHERTQMDPSKIFDVERGRWISQEMTCGDYLHRNLHIELDANGKVKTFYFDVEDITPNKLSPESMNAASAHNKIKTNTAELDRMNMDAKAGDEKADIWTPLARAIEDPTKWSALLSSIEAETGGYIYLAYSKASTNMSFQLNRSKKDGLDLIGPAIDECIGWRTIDEDSESQKEGLSLQSLFDRENYAKGDPLFMVALYDSVKKYNNKADLLLQPRGWRMLLQTADNNIDALKVPKEFVNVYSATEAFSTIDMDYDPTLPICFTDKANLITLHNFNEYGSFGHLFMNNCKINFSSTNIASGHTYVNTKKVIYDPSIITKMGAFDIMYSKSLYLYVGKKDSDGIDKVIEDDGIHLWLNADSQDGAKSIKTLLTSDTINTSEPDADGYTWTRLTYSNNELDINFIDYNKKVYVHIPKVQDAENNNISDVHYTLNDVSRTITYDDRKPLRYAYTDIRNHYVSDIRHPLLQGIIDYFEKEVGSKAYSELPKNEITGLAILDVPFIFSTKNMTLAQLLICAATPFIQRVRANSMRDIIYYEDNIHEYPYSKLVSIKEAPFKNYVNFNYSDYDHALDTKIMNPVQAIRWIMPEFFWKVTDNTYVLPWYFNQAELNDDGTVKSDASAMSMPSIRNGIHLASFDTLYGMSEKDIRLSLDRMTKDFLNLEKIENIYVYKYGLTTDGQPVIEINDATVISIKDILSTPRELGLEMDCPLGVLTKDPKDNGAFKKFSDDGTTTSYRIRFYTNVKTKKNIDILDDTIGVNIDRAANFVQKWFEVYSNDDSNSSTPVAGLVFGMSDDDNIYHPFIGLDNTVIASPPTVKSLQRSINVRLQFLPFVISPFDSHGEYDYDIYDLAYYFGLAGFRASDYRESVYNREAEVVNKGFLFVEDPWILASPILKGASSSTGLTIDKGYTLK